MGGEGKRERKHEGWGGVDLEGAGEKTYSVKFARAGYRMHM